MSGENIGINNPEVHGMDANGWAKFYAFESVKDIPYDPSTGLFTVGRATDESAITATPAEVIGAWLERSVASSGGDSFVESVKEKGAQLIASWYVEVEPGEYKFDMSSSSE